LLFSEREKGFEPSTSTLARWHSTAELLPRKGAPFTVRGRVCQGALPIFSDFGGSRPAFRSNAVEEVDDARLQVVLRADHDEPTLEDELLQRP
jgi:hypothetical protein